MSTSIMPFTRTHRLFQYSRVFCLICGRAICPTQGQQTLRGYKCSQCVTAYRPLLLPPRSESLASHRSPKHALSYRRPVLLLPSSDSFVEPPPQVVKGPSSFWPTLKVICISLVMTLFIAINWLMILLL